MRAVTSHRASSHDDAFYDIDTGKCSAFSAQWQRQPANLIIASDCKVLRVRRDDATAALRFEYLDIIESPMTPTSSYCRSASQ